MPFLILALFNSVLAFAVMAVFVPGVADSIGDLGDVGEACLLVYMAVIVLYIVFRVLRRRGSRIVMGERAVNAALAVAIFLALTALPAWMATKGGIARLEDPEPGIAVDVGDGAYAFRDAGGDLTPISEEEFRNLRADDRIDMVMLWLVSNLYFTLLVTMNLSSRRSPRTATRDERDEDDKGRRFRYLASSKVLLAVFVAGHLFVGSLILLPPENFIGMLFGALSGYWRWGLFGCLLLNIIAHVGDYVELVRTSYSVKKDGIKVHRAGWVRLLPFKSMRSIQFRPRWGSGPGAVDIQTSECTHRIFNTFEDGVGFVGAVEEALEKLQSKQDAQAAALLEQIRSVDLKGRFGDHTFVQKYTLLCLLSHLSILVYVVYFIARIGLGSVPAILPF